MLETLILTVSLLAQPWEMHTIDNSSRGADGTRLMDVNGDGLFDIATPWEQGNISRIYLNPGHSKSKKLWPAVTVGQVGAPEDAVFVDVDGDGAVDVVSSCEGKTRTVFVHWAPKDKSRYLDPAAWKTEAIPASEGQQAWMFVLPMQVDRKNGVDLIAGSKNKGAQVGWFESPAKPRDLSAWKWHPMYEAGWIMSLIPADMNGDGRRDVVLSDRKGEGRGCLWLEHPGSAKVTERWATHRIGESDVEAMFMTLADFNQDGQTDALLAGRHAGFVFHERLEPAKALRFKSHTIPQPEAAGKGSKAVAVADMDLDGYIEIVFSCEMASDRSGVMMLSKKGRSEAWLARDISGLPGGKYDTVELIDLDGDGDLDVLTSEEREPLGVIWYENPTR